MSRRFVGAVLSLASTRPGAGIVRLPKGTWLFHAGTGIGEVLAVLDGAVVLRKANICGEPCAVDVVTRGGILGYRAWLGAGCHTLSAQCAVDTLLCRVPAAELDAVLAADRELEHDLMAHLAQDLSCTRERMLQVATLTVRDRLVVLLARLARDFTTMNDERTVVIAPPISRTDMASLAGMTPESLSRCIRAIEAEGLAHFSRRHVVIPSVTGFRAALGAIGVVGDGYAPIALAG